MVGPYRCMKKTSPSAFIKSSLPGWGWGRSSTKTSELLCLTSPPVISSLHSRVCVRAHACTCVHVTKHTHTCGNKRLTSRVFQNRSPYYIFSFIKIYFFIQYILVMFSPPSSSPSSFPSLHPDPYSFCLLLENKQIYKKRIQRKSTRNT